jgi:DNA replication protein DnaC
MKDGATLPLLLKELRLSTMLKFWEDLTQKSMTQGWSHARYLATLCDYELAERQRRKLSRYMAQSKLPLCKSLETYDFDLVPSLNKAQVMALSNGDLWVKDGKNLLIFGPSGVGKTHLASGIGERLIQSGYRVLFIRTTELLQKLQAAKRDFLLPEELSKLEKYKVDPNVKTENHRSK